MMIAYDTPGQLGNQLWAYTNLIAIAKESDLPVIIILQNNYYKFLDADTIKKAKNHKIHFYRANTYKARCIRKFISFFISNQNKFLGKALSKYLNISIICDGSEASLKKMIKSRGHIFFVNSWEQRVNTGSFIKQHNFIRALIKPNFSSRFLAEERIGHLRNQFKYIVAVHIRRGDYKEFLNGKFYFEDDIYKNKMEQIVKLFYPHNVAFSIFSNEKIDVTNFTGLNVFFKNDNTAIGDMWAISLCDFIIGPLSTFSMWASFWKNVPLLFIERNTVINTKSSFSPVIAQDKQLDLSNFQ